MPARHDAPISCQSRPITAAACRGPTHRKWRKIVNWEKRCEQNNSYYHTTSPTKKYHVITIGFGCGTIVTPRFLDAYKHNYSKVWSWSDFWNVLNVLKFFYAHQGCNYLIKNTVKTVILCNIITILTLTFFFKNIFLWWLSWIFNIITTVVSVTWSLRNHSNMLICCSRNISYYYQCWKQLCCLK